MKILLFGSIAAGKTTLAKRLHQKFPDFDYLAIDNFRKQFGDGSAEAEETAQNEFINAIIPNKNQLIEATGLGKPGIEIYDRISEFDENILVVILRVSEEEIYKRIANRKWETPFPAGKNKIEDIVRSINFGMQFGKIPMMWSELKKTTILQIENNEEKTADYIFDTILGYISIRRC